MVRRSKENPSSGFVGIWIPIELMANIELHWAEKALCSIIWVLSGKYDRCWVSNSYLANIMGLKPDTISKSINKLVKLGYLKSKLWIDENKIHRRLLEKDVSYTIRYENMVKEAYKKGNIPIGFKSESPLGSESYPPSDYNPTLPPDYNPIYNKNIDNKKNIEKNIYLPDSDESGCNTTNQESFNPSENENPSIRKRHPVSAAQPGKKKPTKKKAPTIPLTQEQKIEYHKVARHLARFLKDKRQIFYDQDEQTKWVYAFIHPLVSKQKVSTDRMITVIKWYRDNFDRDQFIPIVTSARHFADKFISLEAAMNRKPDQPKKKDNGPGWAGDGDFSQYKNYQSWIDNGDGTFTDKQSGRKFDCASFEGNEIL